MTPRLNSGASAPQGLCHFGVGFCAELLFFRLNPRMHSQVKHGDTPSSQLKDFDPFIRFFGAKNQAQRFLLAGLNFVLLEPTPHNRPTSLLHEGS